MFLTSDEYNLFIKQYNIDLCHTKPQQTINSQAAAILGASKFQYTLSWNPDGPWVEFEFPTPAEETFARLKFGFLG